ncbi:type II toxin-antitoxin system antitoxin SocA domain-containing protein [Helicobacter sp. 11S02629-2]|uniref:Panacea domain-containing protein n=1 Tax=Helicobacter sp. 11S02629-2 TaxID=1476195 RepID=UPI000BA681A8|nr:type II toxin-antitoxin system antitoxin SocA domain-containing protein [Helicobacter sp. 11S02629-2]PAF41291.1 hypothetical protein BKH40_08465 [Helicobacter sp. 11S02629-2]
MKALDLARYIVQLTDLNGFPVSNLQLQKIMYFVNLKHIKDTGSFLIDEPFEAWQFGPVVEEVYREYSIWAGLAIYTDAKVLDDRTLSPDMNELILNLAKKYPWELVNITHLPNSAWDRTYQGGSGNHALISKELIRLDAQNFKG